MAPAAEKNRWSGWYFPARITALFLAVAAVSMGAFAFIALGGLRDVNQDNTEIRIDRAARAAGAIVVGNHPQCSVATNDDGSPDTVFLSDDVSLAPSPAWDSVVDRISSVNQGAANVFIFDATARTFDRIATSFKTPNGERAGGSEVEPGLIKAGHPAFASLVGEVPFIGEVPVKDRLRYAYLTPILDADSHQLIGALAVDVGFVDDLNRVNGDARTQAALLTGVILMALAIACVSVMFGAFRPLNRLIRLAHDVGEGTVPDEIPLRDRRDEIGFLANALAHVVELQSDLGQKILTDELTGLANRPHFMLEIERRFADVYLAGGFGLILIDLDQFKEVNDGLGHAAGDQLLIELANTLETTTEPGEFLARLGGDEFALITCDGLSRDEIGAVAQRFTDAVAEVTETTTGVTASMGIVQVPDQASTVEVAMSHADLALYGAKQAGRAHWQFYRSSLSSPIQRRVHLASELRRAIDAREIELAYQPLYAASDQRIVGFEALARWNHAEAGMIPPDEFIPVAENAGLINDLGQLVLDLATESLAEWRSFGIADLRMSVNVSSMQLWQEDFSEMVAATLVKHGLPPEALCLELTESVIVHHADGRSKQTLERVAASGVRLAVDDFGTGYSSLRYLGDLAVDQLKIDRSFIAAASAAAGQDQLFAGIVSLGHSLGLQVVAEGVETVEDQELARRHGCDVLQGYLLSRPLPKAEIGPLLRATPRSTGLVPS